MSDKNGTAFVVKAPSIDQSVYLNDSDNNSKTTYSDSYGDFMQSSGVTETQHVYPSMQQDDHEDSILRLVGYIFHKTSLSISVILVLYVSLF